MQRFGFALVLLGSLFLAIGSAAPALAQDEEPAQELPPLQLLTDYPSQVIGIDETADLDLRLRTGTEAQIVSLSVEDLPENWTADFRGRNRLVRSVYVTPDDTATVTLRVTPPEDVEPGEYSFTVIAEGEAAEDELPITLVVQERVPANLSLSVELPMVRGRPDSTFRYNATLENEGDEDLTVNLSADAPPGFVVTFESGTQEVTTLPLAAGDSERINISVEPITRLEVGTYPIVVHADGGVAQASLELAADVVGQSSVTLTTPDGRLSGQAEAGAETTYTLLLQNTGSAPARGIEMSHSAPNGWTVSFEPEGVDELPPGQQQEVTARVQPPDNAIAGDYVVTFRARPEDASNESMEYRVTVRTSTLWGVAGVALIAVAVAVVGLAVARFGRR
ncbi:MAG TPA: NEW3 domain-containing protein [Candidatus Sulfomarinibacteraceae bacterium]|nr:NEW3 domain-containing protein [Candidatus Sulfomarinibacteraceae bacterium]